MANRRKYDDDQLAAAVASATCWADVLEGVGFPRSRSSEDVRLVAERLGLDFSHLGPRRPLSPPITLTPALENSSTIGSRTEGVILAALLRAGKTVLTPFGGGHRYDLAIDDDGNLVRIQCKTARYRSGCVLFATCSITRNGDKVGYAGAADFFGVWCPELDTVYMVPVTDVAGIEGRLRVESVRNRQSNGIRWAADYQLSF